jgi:hypothetical protein
MMGMMIVVLTYTRDSNRNIYTRPERVLGALHVSDENNSNMYAIMYAQECNELLGGGYKYLDVRCPDEIAQGAPYDSVFLVCSLCVPCMFPVCHMKSP